MFKLVNQSASRRFGVVLADKNSGLMESGELRWMWARGTLPMLRACPWLGGSSDPPPQCRPALQWALCASSRTL